MRLLGGHVKHIVSQDAEAVDPFVLSVRVSKDGSPVAVLEREVHDGDGTMFLDMTPLQRLQTGRRPTGFDPDVKLPDWARDVLPEDVRDVPTGAFASTWLTGRARLLGRDLRERMDEAAGSWSRASIDEVVSLAERLVLVNVPKGTTLGWLSLRFHYGHTVSGELQQHDGGTLLEVIRRRTGVPLAVAPGERGGSNGQWLARYSLGVMDTDSLRNLVYGEVLIPVATEAVDGVRLERVVGRSIRHGHDRGDRRVPIRFDDPFWGSYQVDGDTRTATLPGGTKIEDHLTDQQPHSYRRKTTGVDGMTAFGALLTLEADRGLPTRSDNPDGDRRRSRVVRRDRRRDPSSVRP